MRTEDLEMAARSAAELKTAADRATRWFRRLAAAMALVVILLGANAAISLDTRNDQASKFNETSQEFSLALHALCTFRNDLHIRAVSTQRFLNENPKGFAGIPAPYLRQSLQNQQATLDSLSDLPCPPYTPVPPLKGPYSQR